MKKPFFKLQLTLLFIIIVFSSCDKLEIIPSDITCKNQISEQPELISNERLYTFNADQEFGEIAPSTLKIDKTQTNNTRSFIHRKVETKQTNINLLTKYIGIIKTLKWLGLIIVILIAALGFFTIKPSLEKKQKNRNVFRIIIAQIPLILFLTFVSFPYLYLRLWFSIIVIALIVGSSSEFKRKHLFVIPIAIALLAFCGFKAGSWVYIDNALNQKVIISINEQQIGTINANSYIKVRISGIQPKIEIHSDKELIEAVKLPLNNNFKVLLKQAFYPWGQYIYNINGKNSYFLETARYY